MREELKARGSTKDRTLSLLTKMWGTREAVDLYLDRCQVDTPIAIVSKVWAHVHERRADIGKVVDFGAGDGRFARIGKYLQYIGYEVDPHRCKSDIALPRRASLVHLCAFDQEIDDADVCVGNPPYVRNQDLPTGWRERAANSLIERAHVRISGLANAWQYFFLLSLISTKPDGLVALVIPYEWVSRPSARPIREFIRAQKWGVSVYRLRDETFDRVLTTSSITIVDKRSADGLWEFFDEKPNGHFRPLQSESGGKAGIIRYCSRTEQAAVKIHAKRGLSPGTQQVLTLTEGERVRAGLRINTDVVPCITSLREVDEACVAITEAVFSKNFRLAGHKCWLIRTDRKPSLRLQTYIDSVPRAKYWTVTCLDRDLWWKFTMPVAPPLLVASGFTGLRPKMVINTIGARAVGSVCGIYGVPSRKRKALVDSFQRVDLSGRIVPHSNGLKKVEVNQLNTLLQALSQNESKRS